MEFTVYPLTPDRWSDLENLFGTTGAVSRCWCMYWRVGSDYRKRPPEANKADLHDVVKDGPPPGLLAYDGDLVVGWCQLTPRSALAFLSSTRRIERVDDAPVWSISCFYIRKGYRKKGVTSALIAAALDAAKRAGAPALEAYPLEADVTPSSSFTGYASTFRRAGFKVVADRRPSQPVMRCEFAAKR